MSRGMNTEYTLDVEAQRAIVRRYLESDEVREREAGPQRQLDDLIAATINDDPNIAFTLWLVMALRVVGKAHRAGQVLFELLSEVDIRQATRTILLAGRTGQRLPDERGGRCGGGSTD